MSGGRTILGIGVGWCGPEFDAVGPDFKSRGRRCDELIDAIKALWTQDTIRFQGAHYDFGPVKFEPKPLRKPHPPIYYGGNSPAAIARTAARCDGWICAPATFDEIKDYLKTIGELRRRAERDHLPFEETRGLGWPLDKSEVARHAEIGIDRLIMNPWIGPAGGVSFDEAMAEIEDTAAKLKLRDGTAGI